MQLQIELNEKESVVSLDKIIDMVLENAETEQQPQLDFMKLYEEKFMEEIKKYSFVIRKTEFDRFSKRQIEEAVEKQSLDLHEIMADACIAYLRHGMKLGAGLVVELLH